MTIIMIRIKSHLKKNNHVWNAFRRSVYISSVIMFLVSSYFIFKYAVIDRFKFSEDTNEIQKVWENSNLAEDKVKYNEKFYDLIKINPDIKGWLKIKGTVIDYPVLQSSQEDPSFYLYRNYKKEKDKSGSIFINSDISLLERDTKNIVLHGHNMKNGTMFATIAKYGRQCGNKYGDINFFKSSPIIEFDTIFEPGIWKIFAIIKTNSDKKHGTLFYDYLKPFFNSKNDFLKLIYNLKIRSVLNIPVDVCEYDKMLTLSTCSYEMKGFRTVVFARKLRKGESELIDLDQVSVNNNPLMPEGWYKERGMKMPKFPSFEEYEKSKT